MRRQHPARPARACSSDDIGIEDAANLFSGHRSGAKNLDWIDGAIDDRAFNTNGARPTVQYDIAIRVE